VVGSEGTLGIVSKITLKLTKAPKTAAVVTICFDKLEDLCHSVHQLVMKELPLGCVELMDSAMINMLLERHDMDHHKQCLMKNSNLLMLKVQGS
jgi:glycolate oxidase